MNSLESTDGSDISFLLNQNPSYSVQGGVLVFDTHDDVNLLLDSLNNAIEAHISSVSAASNMNDDDFNNYLDSIGFDDLAPLKNWLLALNNGDTTSSIYESYFDLHYVNIDDSLSNDFSESLINELYGNHPSLDPAYMALLSNTGIYKVGSDVIDHPTAGLTFACANKQCCKYARGVVYKKQGNYAVSGSSSFNPALAGGSVTRAEMLSRKSDSRGRWSRHRTNITLECFLNGLDNCAKQGYQHYVKSHSKRASTSFIKWWTSGGISVFHWRLLKCPSGTQVGQSNNSGLAATAGSVIGTGCFGFYD